jgi:prepilin peptidase CpaA
VLDIICELSIALFAVACDLKNRKIPNILCLYGVCSGLVLALTGVSGITPLQSLLGVILPFAGLWFLYVFHVLGAGDIKLFCALGAFTGPDIWKIICMSMVFGALAGAAAVVHRVYRSFKTGDRRAFFTQGLTRICFSVPITLGLLVYVFEEVFGGGV